MKKGLKILIIGFILLAPLVWGILWKFSTHNYQRLPVMGSVEMTGDTIPWHIPPFSFISQTGDSVTEKTFEGKIYVANFFFATCPDVCPKMNGHLRNVYDRYKNNPDVMFLSHTVHPEHDSVPVLLKYSRELDIDNKKWLFVTGRKADIYSIAEEGYKAVSVKGDKPATFIHSPFLVLVDKDRHIRGIYDSQDYNEIKKLKDGIDVLLKEYYDKKH